MATRRPKVPRATLLDGGASTTRKPASRAGAAGSEENRAHGTRAEGSRIEAERTVADFTAKAREKNAAGHGSAASGAAPRTPGKPKPSGGASGGTAAAKASPGSGAKTSGTAKAGGKADGKAAAEPTPVPARAFSGRLLALGLVMLAITVLLAPTVKNWWDQRQQIAQLQEDIRTKQADQEDLQKQIVRWHDPAYVQQQARDRINMVMPGEIGYWVFGKEGGTAGMSAPEGSATTPVPGDTPWTQKFLESVREATK
ncbi:FtsB family cell division protein [Arthrobacter sp. RAF14]|uniref:FtsB family cell division protein n=1 Tax=Arthrobacter sp. RAF14 TaxID=3233051 RepID=UPI003F8F6399